MIKPANRRVFIWPLILPAVTLALAGALQGMQLFKETPQPREPHLARMIPADVSGWSVREVPLGPNEFVSGEVEKVLNFDEALNREYTRAGQGFGVYVAYWGAGKMPTRLVASHTPDRCWTENGWRCTAMNFRQTGIFSGLDLQPAESRVFDPPKGGVPTYVLYWHLVDGRVYDYGERFNAVPNPVLWAQDAVRQALLGNREQYFIRLTSNRPLEDLWSDPGFASVVESLGALGLRAVVEPAADRS
ncbi:MAG TPA: exosortase-associated EpsI family protein [Opitutaceae bacterium]|nr:exosortase-associated EpsI family protein [Opitutaceae bacterium]